MNYFVFYLHYKSLTHGTAGLLTPPRSDEEYSSSPSSERNSDLDETSANETAQNAGRPNFLSLMSVNQELSKLNNNSHNGEHLSDIVNMSSLSLQANETASSRVDDLLLLNETWISNYFTSGGANVDPIVEEQATTYALPSNQQINEQIININNNQSLQSLQDMESLFGDGMQIQQQQQQEQLQMPQYQYELQEQSYVSSEVARNDPVDTSANLTSIDSLLLDDDFLKNIEANIQDFEKKSENNYGNLKQSTHMLTYNYEITSFETNKKKK